MSIPLPNHYVAVAVPPGFSQVIVDAAAREGRMYAEQLLAFAIQGAECGRTHSKKETRTRRKNK